MCVCVFLNRRKNSGLNKIFSTLDFSTSVLRGSRGCNVSVELEEFSNIKFGFSKNFDFADVNVLKRVDSSAGFLNLAADSLRDEFLNKLFKINSSDLFVDDLNHLLADVADLSVLSV